MGDIEDLELAIQKLEQEKTNRDHGIRSLNDEIASQDEVINKLNKEKKARANIEKERRSKEGELKVAQEMVSDLERNKKELEMSIGRKEKDTGSLASKLEDEQNIVAKVQKSIKETQARV